MMPFSIPTAAPLDESACSIVHARSLTEARMAYINRLYCYSLQGAVFCSAMGKGFAREYGSLNNDFIRPLRRQLSELEKRLVSSASVPRNRLKTVLPILVAREAARRRVRVQQDLEDIGKRWGWSDWERLHMPSQDAFDAYVCVIRIHIGSDAGQARMVALVTQPCLHTVIIGNHVLWLVSHNIDPFKTDLYQRLANDALIKISWWDSLAVPFNDSSRALNLEVHARNWPLRPANVINVAPTTALVECKFYRLFDPEPLVLWLPEMEGRWIVAEHHMSALVQAGIVLTAREVLMFEEENYSHAMSETLWDIPVAIQLNTPHGTSLVWRVLCRSCYQKDPRGARHHTSHIC